MSRAWNGHSTRRTAARARRVRARDPICKVCHSRPTDHADHIVPMAEGGADDEANMQGICIPCHELKTADELRRAKANPVHIRRPQGHPGIL
jgi:5-methylcytosine-specific restriction protein A